MKGWRPVLSFVFAIACATYLLSKAERRPVTFGESTSDAGQVNNPAVSALQIVAPGIVSTLESETSPSISRDGKTIVFARYGEDWSQKRGYIGSRQPTGWKVQQLSTLGPIYNLSVSSDGQSIITASSNNGELNRFDRLNGKWIKTESISAISGVTGSYPQLLDNGDVLLYDPDGNVGGGIYRLPCTRTGYASPVHLFVTKRGVAFDGFLDDTGCLYFTWCKTDACIVEKGDGVHCICGNDTEPELLSELGYRWGVQPFDEGTKLLLTDGDDILSVTTERLETH
ncbi:MAG: hypothetical protein AAF662_00660 [Pseudomonadota bacterium]